MSERDQLKGIIEAPLTHVEHSSHPLESVLRDYIAGRLQRSRAVDVARVQAGSPTTRAEVTAHLLTCRRCAQLIVTMRQEPSWLKALREKFLPMREPVPTFARVVILAQFVIIVGLVGVIYFKPAPFFSSLSSTASVLPSQEIIKKSPEQSAPVLHPQEMTIPSSPTDRVAQLVHAHPVTIRVVFREETPVRELESLLQSIKGILILGRQDGLLVRLPPDESLESILPKLSQSSYFVEARKD